jgi:hypothetical protein
MENRTPFSVFHISIDWKGVDPVSEYRLHKKSLSGSQVWG